MRRLTLQIASLFGVIAVLPALPLAQAQGPGGAPAGAPPPPPEVFAFSGTSKQWVWLKRAGGEMELGAGGPGKPAASVAKGRNWVDVALTGGDAIVAETRDTSGRLLKYSPTPGSEPEVAVDRIGTPLAVFAEGERVFWLERTAPAVPGFPFVPAVSSLVRLRAVALNGPNPPVTLAEWPCNSSLPAEVGTRDILGLTGDHAYVRIRRTLTTDFYRVSLSGGEPVHLASEPGPQQGELLGTDLCWIAPSEEATPASGMRCVRRLGSDGTPTTVSDWLPANGRLVVLGGKLMFAGDGLYEIPNKLGEPEFIRHRPIGPAVTDGQSLVRIGFRTAPEVE
jgi:hypothetical protein